MGVPRAASIVHRLRWDSLMQIYLSRPNITEKEIEAVCAVLRSPNLSLGPKLIEFELSFAKYIGRKRAVAVNSGTSGLFLCMLALGISQGDEVITSPFTFIASGPVPNLSLLISIR